MFALLLWVAVSFHYFASVCRLLYLMTTTALPKNDRYFTENLRYILFAGVRSMF